MLLELKCPNNRTAKGVGCSNISKTRLSLDVHAATVNVTSLAKLAILSLSIVSVDSGTLEYSGINTLYIASFGSSIVECAFQIFVNRNVTGIDSDILHGIPCTAPSAHTHHYALMPGLPCSPLLARAVGDEFAKCTDDPQWRYFRTQVRAPFPSSAAGYAVTSERHIHPVHGGVDRTPHARTANSRLAFMSAPARTRI